MDMKKIMAVAATLAAGVVMADGISSSVVGYTGDTTGSDNNFVTVPFNAVGFNTSDLQQIKIDDGGAGTIGYGTEVVSIWGGVPTVVAGSEYSYWDASLDPAGVETSYYWGDANCEKVAFSIAPGQAIVVNCSADLNFVTSGEVPSGAVSFTSIDQNNFTGNPFPTAIDIQAIKISDGGAGTIGYGTEVFSIWEGVPTVVAGSEFSYWDPSLDPTGQATTYYWGDANCEKVTYSIAPNQGVVVNCAEGLTITIDPPYSL